MAAKAFTYLVVLYLEVTDIVVLDIVCLERRSLDLALWQRRNPL